MWSKHLNPLTYSRRTLPARQNSDDEENDDAGSHASAPRRLHQHSTYSRRTLPARQDSDDEETDDAGAGHISGERCQLDRTVTTRRPMTLARDIFRVNIAS